MNTTKQLSKFILKYLGADSLCGIDVDKVSDEILFLHGEELEFGEQSEYAIGDWVEDAVLILEQKQGV